MMIRIRFYPPFVALTGRREQAAEVADGIRVAGVLKALCLQYPSLEAQLGSLTDDQRFRRHALVLLDQEIADLAWPVSPGQCVSLVGPLQGG